MKRNNYIALLEHDKDTGKYGVIVPDIPGFSSVGNDYEEAVQKKEASVTGLGFSIWSGSFVNHAIYAAMQASKINEQEKSASKEYQKDMAELETRIEKRKNE